MDTKLYFVFASAESEDTGGEVNYDLFVEAQSPSEAITLWRGWVTSFSGIEDPEELDNIEVEMVEVPARSGVIGPVEWNTLTRHTDL